MSSYGRMKTRAEALRQEQYPHIFDYVDANVDDYHRHWCGWHVVMAKDVQEHFNLPKEDYGLCCCIVWQVAEAKGLAY